MKKRLAIFPLIACALLSSCGGGTTPPDEKKDDPVDDEPLELLLDPTFKNGFTCKPSSGHRNTDGWQPEDKYMLDVDVQYGTPSSGPAWTLSQHGDVYSLNDKYNKIAGGVPTDNGDGSYTMSDESKTVIANPSAGSLYLELNTSKEYARDRKNQEEWCHILLDTGFKETVSLVDLESCELTIDLDLKKFENHMYGTVNPDVHAAQFLMYIVVKSIGGTTQGNWFWFGIPFFDNRYPTGLPEGGLVDAGGAGATGKYIYQTPTNSFLPGGLQLNEKASIDFDIVDAIGQGLVYAQNHGQMLGATVDDLQFSYMNIGWEVPGTYDVGVEISNFSIKATKKE